MKYIAIVFILSFSILVGCKLETKNKVPQNSAKPEILTEVDVLAMVSEIYETYQNSEDYLIKGIFYPANFLSQDLKLWGEAGRSFSSFNVSPDEVALNNFWSQSYEGIVKANIAIKTVDEILVKKIISLEQAKQLKAECYFNRGLFYFYLASNFGNVPYANEIWETESIKSSNADQNEVFNWVIQDLTKAIAYLPHAYESKSDLGRATKGAALAYIGESYMWLGDYKNAVEAFNKLEGHYELMPNFLDIHAFKHQNNKESIFEIQFNGNENLGWGRDNYSTFIQSFALPKEVGGAALAFVNPILVNSFEQNDKRRRATVIEPGQTHPDSSINISSYNNVQEQFQGINTLGTKSNPWLGNDKERSGYYTVKNWRAPDPSTTASAVFSKANVILMRYGQVLLDLAEAKLKVGDTKGALALINKIRKRAQLKQVSNNDIMPVLLNEYRHELAGEFSLWYVLRRSRAHDAYLKNHFNITIPSGHDLLPIPKNQLRLNSALKQNFGY
ncbi:MAG: hypothetical protein CVT95_09520 [Bacteroidetes bacterium HGW-Bacteroidetes-12]|nr:MAG: hypothetical protein CVT95_09520 [Bacteroidetes bacterium HGW-Bacteroidetes-12]